MSEVHCIDCPNADSQTCQALFRAAAEEMTLLVDNLTYPLAAPPERLKSLGVEPIQVTMTAARVHGGITSRLGERLVSIGCQRASHKEVTAKLNSILYSNSPSSSSRP